MGEYKEKIGGSSDLGKFFVLSFRYSEGEQAIQNDIFSYAGNLGVYREVPPLSLETIKEFKMPKLHKKIDPYVVHHILDQQWGIMKDRLLDPKSRETDQDSIMRTLLYEMIQKDTHFVEVGRKERNVSKSKSPDDDNDPFGSYIRKYAVKRHPIGETVLDTLFRDINNRISRGEAASSMDKLKEVWESAHRGHTF